MTGHLIKSAEAQGLHLTGLDSAKLGTVREVYLDLRSGLIAFLAIEQPSLLGHSGKYYPVPWSAVRFDSDTASFHIDTTKEHFRSAPSYDRDQLANASYRWHEQVTDYFGPRPITPAV